MYKLTDRLQKIDILMVENERNANMTVNAICGEYPRPY